MSKSLPGPPKYITYRFFSLHKACHFLLNNYIFLILGLLPAHWSLSPCLKVFNAFDFYFKRITTVLLCIIAPNEEVDRSVYQNLRYCWCDEQYTYKIHYRCQKTFPARKFSCLKEQTNGSRYILYNPITGNRLPTALRCECSAHSWWTSGLRLLSRSALRLCSMMLFYKGSKTWLCRNTNIFVSGCFLPANDCRSNLPSVQLTVCFSNYVPRKNSSRCNRQRTGVTHHTWTEDYIKRYRSVFSKQTVAQTLSASKYAPGQLLSILEIVFLFNAISQPDS